MKFFNRIFYFTCIVVLLIISGCDKTKPYDTTIPDSQAHFVGNFSQTDSVVTDPSPVINITVGTTDVSSADRVITYNVTSPSGATAGTQYTIDGDGTITMPAGKAIVTIDLRPIYSAYAGGRKDTLVFAIASPSVKPAEFLDTVRVILAGRVPCVEDEVNLNNLLGGYDNTIETFGGGAPYGPYTTTISSVTPTSATTGTIVVENIFDDGWGPITFNLDWTDQSNKTCVVVPQAAIPGSDAGSINSAYAGNPLAVIVPLPALGAPQGTFVYCQQHLTLQMQLGIDGLGYFGALYTVNMVR